ncbi:MAG: UvrD-helicase domain-containing protein [Oscillospiraceae bacterium]|nr:UvrD-helicase domain-containing protein [Oscillospiraceae bacterium]
MSDNSRHLLLLAVPGSGKTTVMVSRIARLIEEGVLPDQILTMTFSREAAKDMASRFHTLFPTLPIPQFSTIHSFCYRVLRHYAARYQRPLPKNIEAEDSAIKKGTLLRQIYLNCHQDFIGEDELETLSSEISIIKNRMIPPKQLSSYSFETTNIGEIFEEYERYKKEHRLMDFDDMLTLCFEIFQKCPTLLAEYRQKYPYIHTDEAQDSSLIQHRIIALLAQDNNLFMVGDEDQSIYSFRGACPEQLLSFAQVYPDAIILKMEQISVPPPKSSKNPTNLLSKIKTDMPKRCFAISPRVTAFMTSSFRITASSTAISSICSVKCRREKPSPSFIGIMKAPSP